MIFVQPKISILQDNGILLFDKKYKFYYNKPTMICLKKFE